MVALATRFEPELGNRGWIVDQLDAYKVAVSFHSFPPKPPRSHGADFQIFFARRAVSYPGIARR